MEIKETARQTWGSSWPLERVLFLMAGSLVLIGSILGAVASPWFLLITGFVAVNQLLYAATGACGASLILHRFAGLRPATTCGSAR
jgi:Flp pilus assembly protein TadB